MGYTAEEARVLAERFENGDLYVCTIESTGETDSYGNEITYHEEQYGILNDVVNILRKYSIIVNNLQKYADTKKQ